MNVERTVQVTDASLHVEVYGAGSPLILVHGGPGLGLEPFKPSFLRAADFLQVIMYDQRGCGRSSTPPRHLLCSVALQVADLDAIRSSLACDTVTLLGHSYGAVLALAYALEHPGRVDRLILVSPATPYAESPAQLHRWYTLMDAGMRRDVARLTKSSLPPEKMATARMRAILPLFFRQEAAMREFLERNIRVSGVVLDECSREEYREDLRPHLPGLTIPVTIIAGRQDKRTPPEYAIEIDGLLPDSELIYMEETGHFPFMEKTDEFIAILKRITQTADTKLGS